MGIRADHLLPRRNRGRKAAKRRLEIRPLWYHPGRKLPKQPKPLRRSPEVDQLCPVGLEDSGSVSIDKLSFIKGVMEPRIYWELTIASPVERKPSRIVLDNILDVYVHCTSSGL